MGKLSGEATLLFSFSLSVGANAFLQKSSPFGRALSSIEVNRKSQKLFPLVKWKQITSVAVIQCTLNTPTLMVNVSTENGRDGTL